MEREEEGKRIIILFAEVITMSKILLINGSPNEKGCTYTALAEIAATLHEQGVETEMIWLSNKAIVIYFMIFIISFVIGYVVLN